MTRKGQDPRRVAARSDIQKSRTVWRTRICLGSRRTATSAAASRRMPRLSARTLAVGSAAGNCRPWEAEELGQWEATARAMPTRDIGSLTAGWQGDMHG